MNEQQFPEPIDGAPYMCGKMRWHELTSQEKANEHERMVHWCETKLAKITKITHHGVWWRGYCRRRTQRSIERHQKLSRIADVEAFPHTQYKED